LLVVIFCPIGNALYQRQPIILLRGAFGLILGNVGLFALHMAAWWHLLPGYL